MFNEEAIQCSLYQITYFSLVYGVKRFDCHLFSYKFMLVTDHKPLNTILVPKKGVPFSAVASLQ